MQSKLCYISKHNKPVQLVVWVQYHMNVIYSLGGRYTQTYRHCGQKQFQKTRCMPAFGRVPGLKVLWPRPVKRLWWKRCEIKRGVQDLCRNVVDHINDFDNDDPGCKTLRQENAGSSLSKLLIWSTAFLHMSWPPPFDFTSSSQPFQDLGGNFLYS